LLPSSDLLLKLGRECGLQSSRPMHSPTHHPGVLIGIQLEVDDGTGAWDAIDTAFSCFFAMEMAFKIFAFKKFFWNDMWHVMDFCIVLLTLLEVVVFHIIGVETRVNLIVFRLARLSRVLRVISMLQTLNHLVLAFIHALSSVFWVLVLLVLALYIFGVIARSTLGESLGESRQWFETLPKTFVTLLQVLTMDSWVSQIGRPVGEELPAAWLFFVGFFLLGSMGLLNLLTAVFIDSLLAENKRRDTAMVKAIRQQKKQMLSFLEGLFQAFDVDESGTLSSDEIDKVLEFLETPGTRVVFENVGLNMDHIQMAIALADDDGDGHVSHVEFLNSLHTLHDNTQKHDAWAIKLKVREVQKAVLESKELIKTEVASIRSEISILQGGVLATSDVVHSIAAHLGIGCVGTTISNSHIQTTEENQGQRRENSASPMQLPPLLPSVLRYAGPLQQNHEAINEMCGPRADSNSIGAGIKDLQENGMGLLAAQQW